MDFSLPSPGLRVVLPLALVVGFLLLGLVGCDAGGSYRRKNGGWTHDGVTVAPEDAASFRPIDDRFARDLRRGERLVGVDAGSFVADESFTGDADASDRVGRWSRGTRLPATTPSPRSPSR